MEGIAERIAFARDDLHDQARSLRNRARIILVKIRDDQQKHQNHDRPEPRSADGYPQAIEMLERSRDLYRAAYAAHGRQGDLAGEATALRELADLYRLKAAPGDSEAIEKAIDAYKTAERAFEALGNDNGLASLRQALGTTYVLRDEPADLAQAESYFRASLATASEPNDLGDPQHPRMKGYALRHLGDLSHRRRDFTMALSFYQTAIATFENAADANSQGHALKAQGRIRSDHARELHEENGGQARATAALASARASYMEARKLLSASPRELEQINSLLDDLDELERQWH